MWSDTPDKGSRKLCSALNYTNLEGENWALQCQVSHQIKIHNKGLNAAEIKVLECENIHVVV